MNIPKFRGYIKSIEKIVDVTEIDLKNKMVTLDIATNEVMPEWSFWWKETVLSFESVELMQSTGLKDINGVEIFEGDILEIVYPALIDWDDITNIDKGVVVFKDYELSVRVDDEFLRLKEIEKCIDVEIIGNIYENKELLED